MIFDILISITDILLWGAFGYIGFSAVYALFFAIAGRFSGNRQNDVSDADHYRRFAVFIPGYKEDAVIVDAARNALRQEYPDHKYEVFVLADSFKQETIESLRDVGAVVRPVSPEPRTKAGSLNLALSLMDPSIWDVAVILDADNIVNPRFLSDLNRTFDEGARVVQCQRTAKNTDTTVALLDAISEGVNNHIFRKGHRTIGLSAGLIGSGMAFEFSLFKDLMSDVRVINGFDKDLEFRIFSRGITIEYAEHIEVLDEKVRSADVFETQRSRWVASHWNFLKAHLQGGKRIVRNIDYVDKVVQMMMLPRILQLAAGPAFILLSLVIPSGPATALWLSTWLAILLGVWLSVPAKFIDERLIRAVMMLPTIVVRMIKAMTRIGAAQKRFVHTPHGAAAESA